MTNENKNLLIVIMAIIVSVVAGVVAGYYNGRGSVIRDYCESENKVWEIIDDTDYCLDKSESKLYKIKWLRDNNNKDKGE